MSLNLPLMDLHLHLHLHPHPHPLSLLNTTTMLGVALVSRLLAMAAQTTSKLWKTIFGVFSSWT